LLSPHYIIVCGQIHTPATLPNHIIRTSLIVIFQPPCNLSNLVCFFFMPSNWYSASHFIPKKRTTVLHSFFHHSIMSTHCNVQPHSLCQVLLLQEFYLCWQALSKNFLCVYPTLYHTDCNMRTFLAKTKHNLFVR